MTTCLPQSLPFLYKKTLAQSWTEIVGSGVLSLICGFADLPTPIAKIEGTKNETFESWLSWVKDSQEWATPIPLQWASFCVVHVQLKPRLKPIPFAKSFQVNLFRKAVAISRASEITSSDSYGKMSMFAVRKTCVLTYPFLPQNCNSFYDTTSLEEFSWAISCWKPSLIMYSELFLHGVSK